jgi:hypothetical protein
MKYVVAPVKFVETADFNPPESSSQASGVKGPAHPAVEPKTAITVSGTVVPVSPLTESV